MGKKCVIGADSEAREKFIEAIKSGMRVPDVAQMFGVSYMTVENYRKRYGLIGRQGSKPWKWYTVYLAGSDTLVCCGTAKECARMMGKSKSTFHSIVSKTQQGILHKYEFVVEDTREEMQDDDDDDDGF